MRYVGNIATAVEARDAAELGYIANELRDNKFQIPASEFSFLSRELKAAQASVAKRGKPRRNPKRGTAKGTRRTGHASGDQVRFHPGAGVQGPRVGRVIGSDEGNVIIMCKDGSVWSVPPSNILKSPYRNPATHTEVAQAYENFHWGEKPSGKLSHIRVKAPTGEKLYPMGELLAVEYGASKAGEPATYRHEFSGGEAKGELPVLAADAKGDQIYVLQGKKKYRVTKRGIV